MMRRSLLTKTFLFLVVLATGRSCTITDENVEDIVTDYLDETVETSLERTCGNISEWDVSRVTRMISIFKDATTFNEDIGGWDVSNVVTMSRMFDGASAFNQDLSNWDVGKVVVFYNIFSNAVAFNGDISSWTTSSATSLYYAFQGASSFNADVTAWNVEKVTTMSHTFANAIAFNRDISAWNVPRLVYMDDMLESADAFEPCIKREIYDAWKRQGVYVDTQIPAFANERVCNLADALRIDYGASCKYGTSDCTCVDFDFETSARHCYRRRDEACGPIPESIGDCVGITELRLEIPSTSLNGSIPTSLGRLVNLELLDVGGASNRLTGSIPTQLGTLPVLKELRLDGDAALLTGTLPATLGSLVSIERLEITNQELRGSVPSVLGRAETLVRLDLSGSRMRLNGTLPSDLGRLVRLETLDMSHNELTGSIPSEFGLMSAIKILRLSNNRLVGPFPDELRQLHYLEELRIDRNNFDHALPNLKGLSRLQILHAHRNRFAGRVERSHFAEMPSLRVVHLGHNNLQGEVPSFAEIANLTHVHLSYNDFVRVPNGTFAHAPRLVTIDLSNQGKDESDATNPFAPNTDTTSSAKLLAKLELSEGAFRDMAEGIRLVISGNYVGRIPRECFRGLKSSRLLLSNLQIRELHRDAFAATSNLRIDLSNNYISLIDPFAFPTNTDIVADENATCSDAYGWEARCAALHVSADADTCNDLDTCADAQLGEFDEATGTTALAACCVFGGGLRSGKYFVFDSASPLTCYSSKSVDASSTSSSSSSSSTASIVCTCSDSGERYDLDSSSCIAKCDAGREWIEEPDRSRPATIVETSVGRCVECPLGFASSASDWDERCVPCQPGSFSDVPGRSVCEACELGTFSAVSNATLCETCPSGRMSDPTSSILSSCVDIPAGTYSATGAKCGFNYFNRGGVTVCEECPFGTESSEGASECSDCALFYAMSPHCETPVAGAAIVACAVIVVAFGGFCAVRRYRKREMKSRDMLRIKADEVKKSRNEIELLSNAWRLEWDSVRLVERLASGGYGEVYRAWLNGSYEVAVKRMYNTSHMEVTEDSEIRFLQRARHPRLVMFIGCGRIEESGDLFVCLEYMNHGTLTEYLVPAERREIERPRRDPSISERSRRTPPSWTDRIQLLCDVSEAMNFLHTILAAIHRDLKADNCLLGRNKETGELRAKVADFGLSRLLQKQDNVEASIESVRATKSASASMRKSRVLSMLRIQKSTLPSISSKGRTKCDATLSPATPTSKARAAERAPPSVPAAGPFLVKRASSANASSMSSMTMTAGLGTAKFLAPEIIESIKRSHSRYDRKVDVYAFGIIMWQTLALKIPWTDHKFSHTMFDAVMAGKRPTMNYAMREEAPVDYVRLMSECWSAMPEERPEFDDILQRLLAMPATLNRDRAERISTGATTGVAVFVKRGESEEPSTKSNGMSGLELRPMGGDLA